MADTVNCIAGAETSAAHSPSERPILRFKQVPQIDALRGVAIMAVLLFHGIDNVAHYSGLRGLHRALSGVTSYGWLGVQLFFVLSGFLITGILCDSKSSPRYYQNFYIRRALRILPAYLVTLVVLKIFDSISWRFVTASLLFVSNMPKLFGTITEYGVLWSLAVEEQFYLLWPILVLRLSPKTLLRVVLALCIGSPILRFAVGYFFPDRDTVYKTYMIADQLGYGALIAVGLRQGFIHELNIKRIARWAIAVSAPLVACVIWLQSSHDHPFLLQAALKGFSTVPFLVVFGGVLLLALDAAHGSRARPRRGLATILPFFGHISYGLYLFHLFIFNSYDRVVAGTWFGTSATAVGPLLVRLLLAGGVAVGIAYLSRRFFEERFLALKDKLAPTAQ